MKFTIALLSLIFAAQSQALECSNKALKTREIHTLPGAGYWMQFGGSKYLTYTSVGGTRSQMYNTEARRPGRISDEIDAFPFPEGDLYVHPGPLRFYKMSEGTQNPRSVRPIYKDDSFNGNYQSLGFPQKSGNHRSLRVLMGSEGTVQDYSVDKNGSNYNIRPVHREPVRACGNLFNDNAPEANQASGGSVRRRYRQMTLQTPVLSRDGSMVSNRDYNSQKTMIYKLSMPSGDCTLMSEIPTETDKVSYSFDNKKVLYVSNNPTSGKGQLFEMDVATGKKRVISGPDEDVMYQTYKPDGTIMYTRRKGENDGDRYSDARSELVMVDKEPVANSDSTNAKALEGVGQIWAKLCSKEIDLDTARAVGSRLQSNLCSTVVTDANIAALEEPYKQIPKATMLASCNQGAGGTQQGRTTR